MDKSLTLNYSLDGIDIIQNDERFSKVCLHAFGDGENAHTMPVSLENLKKTADTIYNIPIVVQFTNYNYDGIGTHSQDEIPVGFVYTDNNPVRFEYDELNDKTYLTINGLLWNKYTNNIVDIIRDSNGTKKVSVEMRINDYKDNHITGKPDILDWTYYAITILSDEVREACQGSNIQLLEFSKDKKEYIGINFSNNASINEGVNMGEENMTERQKVDEIVSSASGYPLDSEDNSIEVDTQMSSCNEINESEQNDKSTANEEVDESKKEDEETVIEESADNSDDKSNITEESDMSLSVNESECDTVEKKFDDDTDDKNDSDDIDEPDDEPDDDEPDDKEKMSCENEHIDMSLEQAMSKIKCLSDENEQLKADNKVYMSRLEEMSDYDELKEFKRMSDEARVKEERMSKVNAIMSQISERGINMSDEDKNYLLSKVEDYEDMSGWENMAKAVVFDKYDVVNSDVQKIGMPYQNDNKSHSASVWDRIKNKF